MNLMNHDSLNPLPELTGLLFALVGGVWGGASLSICWIPASSRATSFSRPSNSPRRPFPPEDDPPAVMPPKMSRFEVPSPPPPTEYEAPPLSCCCCCCCSCFSCWSSCCFLSRVSCKRCVLISTEKREKNGGGRSGRSLLVCLGLKT